MENKPTIELPRIDGESARAYAARVEYCMMGPGRSLEKLRVQSGGKAGIPRRFNTLAEWSAQYNWTDSARQYDEQISYVTVQEAAEQYRADLAAHRKRAMDASKSLFGVSVRMLQQLSAQLDGVEMTQATLGTISKALTVALDLEAHALGLDRVMTDDDSE